MVDRQASIADAAIRVLAAAGTKGFTHRAVDKELGLPNGSAANCFSTRSALLSACAHRLVSADLAEMAPTPIPAGQRLGVDDVGRLLARVLVSRLEQPARDRQRARLELLLDPSLPEDIRVLLIDVRRRFQEMVVPNLVALGCPVPERSAPQLVVFFDGLLYDQLLYPEIALPAGELEQHFAEFVRCLTASRLPESG